MSAVTVLSVVALAAAIVAAGAVTAAAVRSYALVRRLERLADQIGETVEGELTRALTEVAEAARGIRGSAGKIDEAVAPVTTTFRRLEKWTGALATEAIMASTVTPALGKLSGLLGGLGRGISEVLKHGRGAGGAKR